MQRCRSGNAGEAARPDDFVSGKGGVIEGVDGIHGPEKRVRVRNQEDAARASEIESEPSGPSGDVVPIVVEFEEIDGLVEVNLEIAVTKLVARGGEGTEGERVGGFIQREVCAASEGGGCGRKGDRVEQLNRGDGCGGSGSVGGENDVLPGGFGCGGWRERVSASDGVSKAVACIDCVVRVGGSAFVEAMGALWRQDSSS